MNAVHPHDMVIVVHIHEIYSDSCLRHGDREDMVTVVYTDVGEVAIECKNRTSIWKWSSFQPAISHVSFTAVTAMETVLVVAGTMFG
jgi:hypothetical protein